MQTTRPATALLPEARLMAAVVDDAVASFRKYRFATRRAHLRRFREAEEWLMSTDDSWLFSFEYICSVLGIDAGRVRSELRGAS